MKILLDAYIFMVNYRLELLLKNTRNLIMVTKSISNDMFIKIVGWVEPLVV